MVLGSFRRLGLHNFEHVVLSAMVLPWFSHGSPMVLPWFLDRRLGLDNLKHLVLSTMVLPEQHPAAGHHPAVLSASTLNVQH